MLFFDQQLLTLILPQFLEWHIRKPNWKLKSSDFRMTLKNGFGKCLLFVLSANGRKDQNMASSFSRQRKP